MALLDAIDASIDPTLIAEQDAGRLNRQFGRLRTLDLLDAVIHDRFAGRIALVSSFGAQSAVLLHLISRVKADLPVLFLDTGKHFGETKAYRDHLTDLFGLKTVRSLEPDPVRIAEADGDGSLWLRDSDRCCHIRKVAPLAQALTSFDAWLSGRKRFQGGARSDIAVFEADGGRIKINPLAAWSADDIETYRRAHALPDHPLLAQGFLSIGCMPCTEPARNGAERSGRWAGSDRTECGIHSGTLGLEQDGSGI